MLEPITVMLVDDHQLLVSSLETSLYKHSINVIKSLTSLKDVDTTYLSIKPDVLILDIRFQNETDNGLDACSRILSKNSDARIIFLSQQDQPQTIKKAYSIGALAFIRKDEDIDYLINAIKAASRGDEYFSPNTALDLARLSVSKNQPFTGLSERELIIFTKIADGYSYDEIANQLSVSHRTVSRSHTDIKKLLKIDHLTDFTKLAIAHNLITTEIRSR